MENTLTNLTGIVYTLPPYITSKLETLIIILKTIGIAFIIYLIYLILRIVIEFKKNKRLKFIEEKIEVVNQKLDVLLKLKKKKTNPSLKILQE